MSRTRLYNCIARRRMTYQQERRGGYLWAPLRDQRGAALAHWESLAKVCRGDVVVHYQDGAVRALSLATSEAELMPRPAEFGSTPWAEEGRRLLVTYFELGEPIPRSAIAEHIKALQIPYGPIAEDGRVKQGYLWHFTLEGLRLIRAASRDVWPDWVTAMLEVAPPIVDPGAPPAVEAPLVFVSHSHKDDAFTMQLPAGSSLLALLRWRHVDTPSTCCRRMAPTDLQITAEFGAAHILAPTMIRGAYSVDTD